MKITLPYSGTIPDKYDSMNIDDIHKYLTEALQELSIPDQGIEIVFRDIVHEPTKKATYQEQGIIQVDGAEYDYSLYVATGKKLTITLHIRTE